MKNPHIIAMLILLALILPISVSARSVGNELSIASRNEAAYTMALPSAVQANIILEYDDNVPDEMRTAFDKARQLWESRLIIRNPFSLYVMMDEFEDNYPMEVEVSQEEGGLTRGCPSALEHQSSKEIYVEGPESIIVLNKNAIWNYDTEAVEFDGYDAYTVGLRAIAISLGIGTSLKLIDEANDIGVDYNFEFPNYFDRLIRDGDFKYLTECENRSGEMLNFITCGNLFAEGDEFFCPLYAPGGYEPWRSLVYFELDDSLMWAYISYGWYFRELDIYTIDILKRIGWEFDESYPEIVCVNESRDESLSAYLPHEFQLVGTEYDSCSWKLKMKKLSGEYVLIDQSDENQFIIGIIDNINDIYVDENSCAEARIECEYHKNGILKTTPSLNIFLNLKPKIVSVDNFEIVETSPYYFHANFDLRSLGGTEVYVDIEEEYSSSRIRRRYTHDEILSVSTADACSLYYSWIYVTVKNCYGEAVKILEVEPKEY